MKKRIIFATGNENKMKEIRMILADLGLEILSMKRPVYLKKSKKMECRLKKMQRSRREQFQEL